MDAPETDGGARILRVGGVEIRLTVHAVTGMVLLWAVLAVIAVAWLRLPVIQAGLAGLLGALLHQGVTLAHHFSHALAAKRTGYPMQAVILGRLLFLGESVYPKDEPELPGRIHIQRALGGPLGSLILAGLAGAMALALRGLGGLTYWLVLFVALDSFLVYFLGVLLPLGFTDISTILHWRGR